MFVSLCVGVLIYIAAQYVWYSPWAFGPLWTRLEKESPESRAYALALPASFGPFIRGVVLPAVLLSITLHVFRLWVGEVSSQTYLIGVGLLWFLTVVWKYFRSGVAAQRRKLYVADGALLWSLLWVSAGVILFWQ